MWRSHVSQQKWEPFATCYELNNLMAFKLVFKSFRLCKNHELLALALFLRLWCGTEARLKLLPPSFFNDLVALLRKLKGPLWNHVGNHNAMHCWHNKNIPCFGDPNIVHNPAPKIAQETNCLWLAKQVKNATNCIALFVAARRQDVWHSFISTYRD